MKLLEIDLARLQTELEKLATFSDVPPPAVTRILFTPTELAARDYIRQLMREAGLVLREDAVGNIFARWEGQDPTLPAIATGSHIDAIPYSGRYDGTVGVLGAIEAVRALRRADHIPQRSIEIIMFTAEEPTRFGVGCLGSRALAGVLTPEHLRQLRDKDGVDFDSARQHAGYNAPLETVKLPAGHYSGFIELHIEQGHRLERAGLPIGIVSAIAAPATLRVIIDGQGGHAGAVLMPERHDALTASAELILAVERIARASTSPDAVATVGYLEVYPGAVNSIPSRVTLQVDIRDINLASRDAMLDGIVTALHEITERRGVQPEVSILNRDAPCTSGDALVSLLRQTAEALGLPYQVMVSRAYHDTLFMAQICPTTMIFVPSQHGYSHRPEEYTSPQEIANGVMMLAQALATASQS
ncbi:MAG: M20 family metallo-hydrolase [Anaerolineae bacterium]